MKVYDGGPIRGSDKPFYNKWRYMFDRINSDLSYSDCKVCDEWLTYSNFKDWMSRQIWTEKQLDKDIIAPGNKIYGPDTCIFVNRKTNMLFRNSGNGRASGYLPGVYRTNAKVERYSFWGRKGMVFTSDSELEAHLGFLQFKIFEIKSALVEEDCERVKSALESRIDGIQEAIDLSLPYYLI